MDKFKIFGLNRVMHIVSKIGLALIVIALVIWTPLIAFIQFKLFEPYQKYDYDQIEKSGIEHLAKIETTKTINNTTFNGVHPLIIEYKYIIGEKTITDKFETIELDKVEELTKKDSIKIIVSKDKSIIADLEPANFPIKRFWLGPILFMAIGSLLIALGRLKN